MTKDRQFAIDVVKRLRDAGYDALWAGGCVRDSLLNMVPKDYDVATSALPDQVRALFGRRRTIPVGIAFGVIAVIDGRGNQIEVATFRKDAQYSDGRHPDSVQFSTAEQDAARRRPADRRRRRGGPRVQARQPAAGAGERRGDGRRRACGRAAHARSVHPQRHTHRIEARI